MHAFAEIQFDGLRGDCFPGAARRAQRLTGDHQSEVCRFLSERPLQTFGLMGMIQANGLVHPQNRGDFYAYRGAKGELEGVALIGYNTTFDARSDEAIRAFATLAKNVVNPFLILAQEQQLESFIQHCWSPTVACAEVERYWLFNYGSACESRNLLPGLRLATPDDLELVAWAHNQCGIEETGADGLALDPEGFTARCADRIARRRTWVWIEQGKFILKIDVITATREMAYLESLWIAPEQRHKGYGLRLLQQISEKLREQSASICLLAQETNTAAHALYQKAGYEVIDYYQAVFCSSTMSA